MCRISGVISIDGAPLINMLQHQQHGGPDGSGAWTDGNVHLGHNRLSVIDLSDGGKQPMESNRWVLTYNGEIYNHMELRNKLGAMPWASHCDTLTLLNCLEHKGFDWTVRNIQGMFSLGAYDKFEKKLYLAVDQHCIKPLFWFKDDKYFAFASSPAALTYLRDKWRFNKPALLDMLCLGGTKDSLFEDIHRLPGGRYLIYDIDSEDLEINKWYDLKEHQCTEEDLIETVKESIRSVRVADVPVYLFLSGGIDSTVTASQCPHMNAVHLDSPEKKYARQVAEKYGQPLFFVEPTNFHAQNCLEDYALQSGDCSAAAIVPYIVSKEVSKLGKVAISSNGADELFYGYNRMHTVTSEEQFRHIFRDMPSSWGTYMDYRSVRELELETYVEYDLNKTLDFASMCFGLEVRVPYLNKKVVEMALSIPREQHVNGYGNKSILKKFLKSEGFDNSFINRAKLGFSLFTEPIGHEDLKRKGLRLLKDEFGINPHFTSARDVRYFENIAAAFYCWFNVWKPKLI